jgi:hypothetical protein
LRSCQFVARPPYRFSVTWKNEYVFVAFKHESLPTESHSWFSIIGGKVFAGGFWNKLAAPWLTAAHNSNIPLHGRFLRFTANVV